MIASCVVDTEVSSAHAMQPSIVPRSTSIATNLSLFKFHRKFFQLAKTCELFEHNSIRNVSLRHLLNGLSEETYHVRNVKLAKVQNL